MNPGNRCYHHHYMRYLGHRGPDYWYRPTARGLYLQFDIPYVMYLRATSPRVAVAYVTPTGAGTLYVPQEFYCLQAPAEWRIDDTWRALLPPGARVYAVTPDAAPRHPILFSALMAHNTLVADLAAGWDDYL